MHKLIVISLAVYLTVGGLVEPIFIQINVKLLLLR